MSLNPSTHRDDIDRSMDFTIAAIIATTLAALAAGFHLNSAAAPHASLSLHARARVTKQELAIEAENGIRRLHEPKWRKLYHGFVNSSCPAIAIRLTVAPNTAVLSPLMSCSLLGFTRVS